MSVGRFTAVTLISYLISLQIFICFFYVNTARLWYTFSGNPIPHDQFYSQVDTIRNSLTREHIIELLRPTSEALYYFVGVSLDIVRYVGVGSHPPYTCIIFPQLTHRCSNSIVTFFTGVGFFFIGLLGKHLSTHTLFSILAIILFTIPVLYQKYRESINYQIFMILQSINKRLSTISFLRHHNIRIATINLVSGV
uniref:Reticulon-like protein n=1 Tax=Lygus hesperus TaxID=30085 RepID=A0A0A9YB67_LYGHE